MVTVNHRMVLASSSENLEVEAAVGLMAQATPFTMAVAPYLEQVVAQAEVVAAIMERLAEPGVVTFQQLVVRLEVEVQAVLVLAVIMVVVMAAVLEAMQKMAVLVDNLAAVEEEEVAFWVEMAATLVLAEMEVYESIVGR